MITLSVHSEASEAALSLGRRMAKDDPGSNLGEAGVLVGVQSCQQVLSVMEFLSQKCRAYATRNKDQASRLHSSRYTHVS